MFTFPALSAPDVKHLDSPAPQPGPRPLAGPRHQESTSSSTRNLQLFNYRMSLYNKNREIVHKIHRNKTYILCLRKHTTPE